MSTNRPLKVFLCHSSADKPAVRELYQKLRAEPWIEPWLDEEELFPGMDWNMEIEKAIEATDVILVCLSNNSITKEGYVQREIRIALDYADYKPEGTLFIIPVRLEECVPPKRLARWQYADYFEGQRERGISRLLSSLNKLFDPLVDKPLLELQKRYDEIADKYIEADIQNIEKLLGDLDFFVHNSTLNKIEKDWVLSAQKKLLIWKIELTDLALRIARSKKLIDEAKAGNDESKFFLVLDEFIDFRDYEEREDVRNIYAEVRCWARAFSEISILLEELRSSTDNNLTINKAKLARAIIEFDSKREMYITRKAIQELE